MPSRSKEDTWTNNEIVDALKKSKHRSRDDESRSKHKSRDKDDGERKKHKRDKDRSGVETTSEHRKSKKSSHNEPLEDLAPKYGDEEERRSKKKKHKDKDHDVDEYTKPRTKHKVGFSEEVQKEVYHPSPDIPSDNNIAEKNDNTAEADAGEYEYDQDEFDDYDDDFEEFDEDEPDTKNEPQTATQNGHGSSSPTEIPDMFKRQQPLKPTFQAHNFAAEASAPRTQLNFMAAVKRTNRKGIAGKMMQRAEDLLKIIQLDSSRIDILDLPPLNEYELYVRNFGLLGAKQTSTQTGDDNGERGCQTDDVELWDKWTQHPSDGSAQVSGGTSSAYEQDPLLGDDHAVSLKVGGGNRVTKFVDSASLLVDRLLGDITSSHEQASDGSHGRNFGRGLGEFSTPFTAVKTPDFKVDQSQYVLKGVAFFAEELNTLLTWHVDARASHPSFVCVWDAFNVQRPEFVLKCEGVITAAAFSPQSPDLVFVGLGDGAALVYDLREPIAFHEMRGESKSAFDVVQRRSTYDSRGALSYSTSSEERMRNVRGAKGTGAGDAPNNLGHCAKIVSVVAVGGQKTSPAGRQQKAAHSVHDVQTGIQCEIMTLDETGIVCVWTVVESSFASSAGDTGDLGLSPNGRVKLVLTSRRHVLGEEGAIKDVLATSMIVSPQNANHFYVGINWGATVVHTTRYSSSVTPRVHTAADCDEESVDFAGGAGQVNALTFHRFVTAVFLVGTSDGTIRLHHAHRQHPLVTMQAGGPVVQLNWSPTQPHIFVALVAMPGGSRTFCVFNALGGDGAAPVEQADVSSANEGVTIETFYQLSSITTVEKRNKKRPIMATCRDGETVTLHYVSKLYCEARRADLNKFEELVRSSLDDVDV